MDSSKKHPSPDYTGAVFREPSPGRMFFLFHWLALPYNQAAVLVLVGACLAGIIVLQPSISNQMGVVLSVVVGLGLPLKLSLGMPSFRRT